MSAWPAIFATVQVVGWALLHFFWQAAAVGVLYALLRRCLPRGESRYLLGMLALLALALCPVLTAWRMAAELSSDNIRGIAPVAAAFATVVAHGKTSEATGWQAALSVLLPWIVLVWSCGVALLSARVWRHWRRLRALVRAAQAEPAWQERLRSLALRFGLHRGVRVLSSARVATPTLVGWIRPVILLPIAVSSGFPVAQVEMILAHELAHLRRFDHLANLFQVVLETLLFYHPVVHWISRDVRNERELCCDALALRVTGGNRRDFATALVELEEFREQHAGLTLAARGGVLLERVGQITGTGHDRIARQPGRFVGALPALLITGLLLSVLWRQAELRQELSASNADIQHLLTSQLLPATIRMPMRTIANLIPRHIEISPVPAIAVRAPAATALSAEAMSPIRATSKFTLAAPAVADLNPTRLGLASPAIPQRAVSASKASEMLVPIHIEQPVYPLAALEQGVEGKVVVEFGINADGSVRDPRVVSAQPESIFDHAAMQALQGWKFAPADSIGFDRRYRQTFTFTLHPGNETAAREVRARAGCYTVTGSHICRSRSLDETFVSGVVH